MEIRERFNTFTSANYFSRVDNKHLLELHIGLDEKGRKAIELRANFTPKRISGTSCIEVNQYHKEPYNTIRFSLIDDEMSGLFYKFCEDIIEQTQEIKEVSDSYQAVVNRFFQWKKLFIASKKIYLTEPEIMGLIGEILFLKGSLAERVSLPTALNSWSGQELTHKDFSYKDTWFEVKAIGRGNQTIKISSLEQLDSDVNGELAVFSLEKMSSTYSGLTLNKVILETKDMFCTQEEKDLFLSKVALQGYEYSDYYDDFVFELSGFSRFFVSDGFPKLTRKNISNGIRKAMYEIALIDIKIFEIKD